MASKTWSGQNGSDSLQRFAECAVAMRNILHQDADLSDPEFRFIENHFQVLEMAYLRWKRKHRPHLSAMEGGTLESKAV